MFFLLLEQLPFSDVLVATFEVLVHIAIERYSGTYETELYKSLLHFQPHDAKLIAVLAVLVAQRGRTEVHSLF